ncbi:LacI family DNA-binding transcriptional regulator [Actinokineospora sp. 24-640]
MAQRRARLIDVAEAAGVSIAAASRALSGSPGVSDTIAARVREVAAEMGYVANVHARTLAGGASTTIGLLVHEIGDPYFAEIASGVLRVGARQGLTVQIGHTGRDPDSELAQIRALAANGVRAIIIAGSGFVDPRTQAPAKAELRAFQAAGGRVAVIGRHHFGADAVLPDNIAGGRDITAHLLSLGHRRIAFAVGARALNTVADRLTGAAEALAAAGLSLEDLPVVEEEFTRVGGRRATHAILDAHPEVTAIAALNDDMAIGVLAALRARGLTVPGDISVSGFDDVAVVEYLWPALTTVRLPMAEMGEQVLELALKSPSARVRRRYASHTLVIRDSTAPPRAA